MEHSRPDGIIRKYYIFLQACWTIVVLVSLAITLYFNHKGTIESAAIQARTYVELNRYYRTILSEFGGVYVPTDKVEPNPFLDHPERDVRTTGGKDLTLVNPAYMTRLVFESMRRSGSESVINRITSLRSLNPANNPDAWEEKALRSFESGSREALEVSEINEKPHLRLMTAFMVEKSCLKCHVRESFKEGDVQGGISIAVPLRPFYEAKARTRNMLIASHVLLWALVSVALLIFTRVAIRNEKTLERTKALSQQDPLTKLANRRPMEKALKDSIAISDRYGSDLSVIMGDLDHFKKYNDLNGHKAGDELLVRVAEIMMKEIRESDLAARYGGEEFMIVLPHTSMEEAIEAAERIRKNIESSTPATISFGVATFSKGMRKEELVENADKALYSAKQKGRNRVEVNK